jgi:hypothetical protein
VKVAIEATRSQLLAIVHDLDAIKFRLLGVQASLPPGILEFDRFLEMEATDPAAILRAAIACALQDHLGPLARDLEAAVVSASSDGRADSPGEGEA